MCPVIDVYIHIYGKHETRPGKKMGHVTIVGKKKTELLEKAKTIKQLIRVIS